MRSAQRPGRCRWVPDSVFGYVARCQRDHQDLITLDPVAYGEPGARPCASTGAFGEARQTLCSAADPVPAAASATLRRRRGQSCPPGCLKGRAARAKESVSCSARCLRQHATLLGPTARCDALRQRARPPGDAGGPRPRRRGRQVLGQPVVPRQRQRRQRRAVRVHLLGLGVRDARGALQRVQLPQQPGAPAAAAPCAWISPMRWAHAPAASAKCVGARGHVACAVRAPALRPGEQRAPARARSTCSCRRTSTRRTGCCAR